MQQVQKKVLLHYQIKEVVMRYRKKMRKKKDRKVFSRTAKKFHKKNVQGRPMRGGIRL